MRSGIRQGAVESPHMFAAAIDWVLHDTALRTDVIPVKHDYEGLGVTEAAFVAFSPRLLHSARN